MNFFKPITRSASLLTICGASLLLGSAGSAPVHAAGLTLVNSGSFGGRTYEVWRSTTQTDTFTWSDAKAAAAARGGALVSINSQAENNYVASLIQDSSLYAEALTPPSDPHNWIGPYIGLFRVGSTVPGNFNPQDGWQWLDGTLLPASDPLSSNWWSGQPDGFNGDNVGSFYNSSNGLTALPPTIPAFPVTWGDIYDGANILVGTNAPGPNPYLANSFVLEKVPGPLPVMGALAGFRLSRRLRRRTSKLVSNS